ncbi:proton-conducting transporter membrane subunit, partial [Flexistipes sinusarabici]|uniref:proton-conducting transporter transmembrane domain-containing protein n=1 Tax=Flexistipes sinusarabici TaxID=2352 RepID=UPI0023564C1F
MEMIQSLTPVYAVLVSLIAIIPIYISRRSPNLREFWTILASVIKFLLIVSLVPPVMAGKKLGINLFEIIPGISFAFEVDPLGLFFALTASFLWIITSFYSIGYMRSHNEHKQTRFFICFAGSLSATIGAAFSANLFTMYIFYEALTLFTYPLIIHEETKEAFKGARIYLIYLLGTSIAFLLPAIVGTYITAGSVDFVHGGLLSSPAGFNANTVFLITLFILYILGIAKAAIMPLHSWLPNAMVAPTPVSALLHAVAVVKMGVFVILRVVLDVFGIDLLSSMGIGPFLAYFASFTILLGSI